MHLSDDPRKSSVRKLLHFRAPETPETSSQVALNLAGHPGPNQVPHDIAALRRPAAVESITASRLEEQDGLAHDVRNLLTSLELFSGLLAGPGVLAEEHKHYAEDLKSLVGPLESLVDRLSVLSLPRAYGPGPGSRGEPVFVREPLRPTLRGAESANAVALSPSWRTPPDSQNDAGLMVKSCERLLAAIAGPSVALNISYERGLGAMSLSGEELTRTLINLVKNASEAMPRGGRVTIRVRKALSKNSGVLLTIEDTGGGIPAHAIGQIFQAGFSSKKAGQRWPAIHHHGLGLTIVRDLVEGAGGSVRVTSVLRKGTTFEISLPRRRV